VFTENHRFTVAITVPAIFRLGSELALSVAEGTG